AVSAAHRTAHFEDGEPSTPTTMGLLTQAAIGITTSFFAHASITDGHSRRIGLNVPIVAAGPRSSAPS
ncbi:MAG: hypothetical protein M3Y49_14225, partial [Actinomycetota bacterium]|nr:hypothetical protein [Actinomycetota bacterium]